MNILCTISLVLVPREGERERLGIYNTRKLFASDQEALAPCIPGRHWWGTGSGGFSEIQRRGKQFCRCLGGASPSQDGPLGCESQVIFEKDLWGAGLSDEKGRVGWLFSDLKSKSEEESSSRSKQRDESCGGQSSEPKNYDLAPYCLGGLRGSALRAAKLLR